MKKNKNLEKISTFDNYVNNFHGKTKYINLFKLISLLPHSLCIVSSIQELYELIDVQQISYLFIFRLSK